MTNDSNPYRFVAMEPEGYDASSPFRHPESGKKLDAKDVRRLAFSQRGLLICTIVVVTYLLFWGAGDVFGSPQVKDLASISPILAYAFVVAIVAGFGLATLGFFAGLFFVFAVGRRTHWLVLAMLFTLLSLSPPLALAISVYLHFRANYVLRRHGIPVGWLGPSWRSLPPPNASPLPASTTL